MPYQQLITARESRGTQATAAPSFTPMQGPYPAVLQLKQHCWSSGQVCKANSAWPAVTQLHCPLSFAPTSWQRTGVS